MVNPGASDFYSNSKLLSRFTFVINCGPNFGGGGNFTAFVCLFVLGGNIRLQVSHHE